MKATIGRIVVVKGHGVVSNGTDEAPAVINRVWSEKDTSDDLVCINATAFPDCASPRSITSVMLYDNRDKAEAVIEAEQLSCQEREIAFVCPTVAFWPDRS